MSVAETRCRREYDAGCKDGYRAFNGSASQLTYLKYVCNYLDAFVVLCVSPLYWRKSSLKLVSRTGVAFVCYTAVLSYLLRMYRAVVR